MWLSEMKHEENDAKYAEAYLHVTLSPFWLGVLIRHEGIETNTPKSKVLGERFGKPSFIQMQPNARAILARLDLDQVCRPSMLPGFVDPACSPGLYTQHAPGVCRPSMLPGFSSVLRFCVVVFVSVHVCILDVLQ